MGAADPLDLIGTTIAGKYTVERVVGASVYAVVYKATHLIWKRPVAIKVFSGLANFSASERTQLLDAFIHESTLLADLSARSAAICQARDVGSLTTNAGLSAPYMVLEWLEGRTLDAVLADESARGLPPRTLAQVVTLLEPVVTALALAHRKGIAHRDIKPANVFVLGDAREGACPLKLLDFGIAKVVQDAQTMASAFERTNSPTSFTPTYGTPEQFSRAHGPTGPWTDVFALALVMGEMLTGREGLPSGSVTQTGYAATDKQVRPTPRTLGAIVTDEVEAVFRKALAVSPQERYQTAGELWNELRGAMHMDPLRRVGTTDTPPFVAGEGPAAPRRGDTLPLEGAGPRVAVPFTPPPALRPDVAPSEPIPAAVARGAGLIALRLGAVALVLVGGMAGFFVLLRASAPDGATPSAQPSATQSPTPPSPPPAATCAKGAILIQPGTFYMGSDDREDFEFERPAHRVVLREAFCMDAFEVTVADYIAVSDTGAAGPAGQTNDWRGITAAERQAFDPLCNVRAPEDRARHPINCVTWDMAEAYCAAKRMRLPTEAEWEYAARGPDGRKYPWGDELPSASLLNACGKECVDWGKMNRLDPTGIGRAMYPDDDGFPTTAPVGSFPAGKSRYGIQDVVGNVWEWVKDWYAPYTADERTDPRGPESGKERVIRGGAWNGAMAAWVRPTFRYHDAQTKRSHGIGFRCAATFAP